MKTILFDIGNVLINFDQQQFYETITSSCHASIHEIRMSIESERLILLETGILSPDDFMDYFKKQFGLNWNADDWVQVYAQAFQVNEAGENLRQTLIQNGCSVSLLSNISVFSKKAVESFHIQTLQGNAHNFYSYELGFHKPDKNIYLAACRALNVAPAECIFLDDLETNVNGAKDAELEAYQFNPQNITDIKKILLSYI